MTSSNVSPNALPSIADLARITQSLAMLDAIVSPDWEDRYYSYNKSWGPSEQMASMRDGSGDDWYLLFDSAGAALKGFAHKLAGHSSVSEQIRKEVPASFSSFLGEPAFSMDYATFCYWCPADSGAWSKVLPERSDAAQADDGSADLLALLVSGPGAYKEWSEGYYEAPISLDSVVAIFAHEPLTTGLVHALNPDADLSYALSQAEEIGYPASKL